jgi:chromosome partitioning protein
MRTIAIVNEKGGTGKTTTAVNLAATLGEAGKEVLLVDLDGQAASSRWLGVQDDSRFADALWHGTGLDPLRDVMPHVALAPGHGKLDAVAHDLRPTQGGQLRKLLSEQTGFDYILIDCPPSLGNRLIGNALLAAGEAIVPVETSILALDGLKMLLTTLDDVRDGFGHHLELTGVLACRYDPRTRLSRLVLEELRRALPGKVFNTVIRENVRMRECPATSTSILGYAPDSHAAQDYRALAKELLAMHEAADANPAAADQTPHLRSVTELDPWKQIAPFLHRQDRKKGHDETADQADQPPPAQATEGSAALALEEVVRHLKEAQQEEALQEPASPLAVEEMSQDSPAAAEPSQVTAPAPTDQPPTPQAAAGEPAPPPPATQPPAVEPVAAEQAPAGDTPPPTAPAAPPSGDEAPNVDDLVWQIDKSSQTGPQDRDKAHEGLTQARDYPALQEAIKKMAPLPAIESAASDPRLGKRPVWRRLLDKIIAGK